MCSERNNGVRRNNNKYSVELNLHDQHTFEVVRI